MFGIIVSLVILLMLAVSFFLGIFSLAFARRETIWKSLGIWGLGLGIGLTAIALSIVLMYIRQHEVRGASDMAGAGQFLIAVIEYIYFLIVFITIIVLFSISKYSKINSQNEFSKSI